MKDNKSETTAGLFFITWPAGTKGSLGADTDTSLLPGPWHNAYRKQSEMVWLDVIKNGEATVTQTLAFYTAITTRLFLQT